MEDIKITYGLLNLREERELARASFGYIAKDIREMKTNCIRFGFHSRIIYEKVKVVNL